MSEHPTSAAAYMRTVLDKTLSGQVRGFLRPRGFTKHGRTFRRTRGELYDMINFQGSVHNLHSDESEFFVNVGVGSVDMDRIYVADRRDDTEVRDYVLDRRWERLVSPAPERATLTSETDPDVLAAFINGHLTEVLAVIESLGGTAELARWAVEHNWLHKMEKTSHYLAATGEVELLATYARSLRVRFGHETRWAFFNRHLILASGDFAPRLIEQHVLDPADQPL